MAIQRKALRRPPVKQDEIVQYLRGRILSGDLAPGARLPNRLELRERFDVSPVTVQRALDRLIAQGFVRAHVRHGTFVVDSPPHLHHFGLVLPRISSGPGGRFYESLAREGQRLSRTGGCVITNYGTQPLSAGAQDHAALRADVLEQGLAGLLFASEPRQLFTGSPVLDAPGLARVAIAAPDANLPFPVIIISRTDFFRRAFEHLARQGCKRLAVLDTAQGLSATPMDQVIGLAQEFGLTIPRYWSQVATLNSPISGRQSMHLLFGDAAAERPDGLVIADDNLVEDATLGLCAAGLPGRMSLKVVAHCNFPWLPPAHHPVTWLGVDLRALMRDGIALLESLKRGEDVPRVTLYQPVFADNLGYPV